MADDQEDDFGEDILLEEAGAEDVRTASESSVSRAVVEAFRQRGAELPDDMDDDALIENIKQLAARVNEVPTPMELAELREIKARYQTQAQAQPAKKEVEEAGPAKTSRIEYPSEAEQYVKWDEAEGRYVPKSEKYPNLPAVDEMNRWYRQSEENKKRLVADPLGYLEEIGLADKFASLESKIKAEVLKEIQEQKAKFETQAEVDQWWGDHGGEIYQVDSKGYVKTDMAGNPLLTPLGSRFTKVLQDVQSRGFNGHGAEKYAFELAERWAKRQSKRTEEAEGGSVDPKQQFVQRGREADERAKSNGKNRVVDRAASVVTAAENGLPQNGGEGFAAIAMRKAQAKGLI